MHRGQSFAAACVNTHCLAGYGDWLPWLEREFAWTEMTATRYTRYMNLFTLSLKSNTVLDLDLPMGGLYLLAAPSTPDGPAAVTIPARAPRPAGGTALITLMDCGLGADLSAAIGDMRSAGGIGWRVFAREARLLGAPWRAHLAAMLSPSKNV